tara:strand:+ start:8291 stop:8965 length:675 start_codon:yes stop_codon:yes gene_type:complete
VRTLAIVPARGGSKGIYKKNISPCAGKPLIHWTLEAAQGAASLDCTVVSTDDVAILEASVGFGAILLNRPEELAQDDSSTESVIANVLDQMMSEIWDVIVLLQPTSPTRCAYHIDEAVALLERGQFGSVLSVVPSHAFLWEQKSEDLPVALYDFGRRPMRQAMNQYEENGAVYVFTREHWERTGNRLGGKIGLYVMEPQHRLQIDEPIDMRLAEALLCESALVR